MAFEYPLAWWALVLVLAAAAFLAYRAYARPVVPLSRPQRAWLSGLRLLTFLLLIFFLMRPVVIEPGTMTRDAVVPILIDTSRSMRLADAGGRRRIDRAAEIVQRDLVPALGREFQVEVLGFGEALAPADPARLQADGRRSDLDGALRAARERYRGRPLAGLLVVSDGGDTSGRDAAAAVEAGGPPVYPVGVGSPRVQRDREVLAVDVGEAALAESVVELGASVVSHGFGEAPIEVRVLENGRPIQVRRVTPPGDGSPVRETFQVSPRAQGATVYTVEVPADPSELAPENNSRSVIVRPPGPRRRVLLVEGAPGYEHSFLRRAWTLDPGLELDSVVRKGQNDRGEDTFYVQGAAARTAALAMGYPQSREALFVYDAVVLGNIEADFFTSEQLAMTADFVAVRGGGLLVLGAWSFAGPGLGGTPLEEVLPVEIGSRGSVARASAMRADPNRLQLTPDGEIHPIMQVGSSPAETRERWAAMPALAAVAPLGGPRPGATVLAVTASAGGGTQPLVALQRYGRGRAIVFAGEAAWRWKMMLPSSDRTYDTFWRQVARWLATPAPGAVTVTATGGSAVGDSMTVEVGARDARYEPVRDATVTAVVRGPGGAVRELRPSLANPAAGEYVARFRPEQPGVYHVRAEARRGTRQLGASDEWILVGGSDPELADPRLNDEVLRRLALASGGRYVEDAAVAELPSMLRARAPDAAPPVRRDLWHSAWTFLAVVLLLSAEWTLRRRWGLR